MDEAARAAFVEAVARDWRAAGLDEVDMALAAYAEKLTRTPGRMEEADVEALRAVGLDDVAIHDLIQVIAYFNYINRVADGVDVELEPEMRPRPPR
ncbi:MAG: hypothetical protein PVJ89_09835 [Planctomycetota bacterium]|jgi:uncharacterized peroxidase-related enzyme